jgi:hypothetical protein
MNGRSGGMESRAAFMNRNFTFTNTQVPFRDGNLRARARHAFVHIRLLCAAWVCAAQPDGGASIAQMNSIGRENATLLRKLQTIAMKGSGAVECAKPAAATKRLSSHEINRRKKQQEIAHANMRIASRLQNAKGTFDSRRMREDQANQEKYLRNVAQYPVAQRDMPYRSKPAASSRPPWFKELPQTQRRVARPEWQS